MNNNRDMFYNSFGYQGNIPMQFMPYTNNMVPTNPMMYQYIQPSNNNMYYNTNDINSRLTKIENNINKLNQRITRLENSTNNTTNIYNNEPDTNLYML